MNYELNHYRQDRSWAQRIGAQILDFLPRPASPCKGEGLKKGFGLLEVLISAVIIIIILSALVTIGRAALSNNEYLAQRAQATYLAQEGVEIVRQIRDTNWIDKSNTTNWGSLPTGTFGISFNAATHKYVPSGASDSMTINNVPFTRTINVNTVDTTTLMPNGSSTDLKPYAVKVRSRVTWTFSGQSKFVELSEMLTNWRPDF